MEDATLDECLTNAVAWLDRAAVAATLDGAEPDLAAMLRYLRQQAEKCRLEAVGRMCMA